MHYHSLEEYYHCSEDVSRVRFREEGGATASVWQGICRVRQLEQGLDLSHLICKTVRYSGRYCSWERERPCLSMPAGLTSLDPVRYATCLWQAFRYVHDCAKSSLWRADSPCLEEGGLSCTPEYPTFPNCVSYKTARMPHRLAVFGRFIQFNGAAIEFTSYLATPERHS